MLIIVGASASGKSSFQDAICMSSKYRKLVTYTTRPRRDNESDDAYHFVDEAFFKEHKDEFTEIAEYNGWKYGSIIPDDNEWVCAVMTPAGMREARRKLGDKAHVCYLKVSRRARLIMSMLRGDNIDEAIRRNLSDVGQFDGIENEVDEILLNSFDSKTCRFLYSPKQLADIVLSK